jgi:hypothetical protein
LLNILECCCPNDVYIDLINTCGIKFKNFNTNVLIISLSVDHFLAPNEVVIGMSNNILLTQYNAVEVVISVVVVELDESLENSSTIAKILAYVPVAKPRTPNRRMRTFFMTMGTLVFGQKVISSKIGGKIRAKNELPNAPTNEINKSIFGIKADRATVEIQVKSESTVKLRNRAGLLTYDQAHNKSESVFTLGPVFVEPQ